MSLIAPHHVATDFGIGKAALSIEDAAALAPICRTKIYHAIADGSLRAVKFGRRTMILTPDFIEFLRALPRV